MRKDIPIFKNANLNQKIKDSVKVKITQPKIRKKI